MNSCQSELAGAELVTHDGRFNTELKTPSFGAAAARSGRTFAFAAESLQLLGFFFMDRAERETIAAHGTVEGS